MDVAMEGKNTALLTLLILIQFAEMKSAVLKELSQDKLWAICYNGVPPLPKLSAFRKVSPGTRFALLFVICYYLLQAQISWSVFSCWCRLCFSSSITSPNTTSTPSGYVVAFSCLGGPSFYCGAGWLLTTTVVTSRQDEDWLTASEWLRPLLFSLLIIYLSELTVDWLKHTSIINFTDLSPHMYTELAYKISKRLLDVDDKSVRTTPTANHNRHTEAAATCSDGECVACAVPH
jgi:hypothetical protein